VKFLFYFYLQYTPKFNPPSNNLNVINCLQNKINVKTDIKFYPHKKMELFNNKQVLTDNIYQ